ncbi:MAG TPA: hypothetical protein VMB75_03350, partial [Rhodocyclaceae bacterium]|nr:hypothetical protein [Rhodocyclaceae bacterium]
MESAGVALMILDACTDPKRYFATWAAFLVRPVESAGRETLVTLAGGVIGSLLLFAGWLLNWRAEHIG